MPENLTIGAVGTGDGWKQLRVWLKAHWRQWSHRNPRQLRLCESLPLGDRRFVAVIEFGGERFLIGGTGGSLVLLSRLSGESGHEAGIRQGEK